MAVKPVEKGTARNSYFFERLSDGFRRNFDLFTGFTGVEKLEAVRVSENVVEVFEIHTASRIGPQAEKENGRGVSL